MTWDASFPDTIAKAGREGDRARRWHAAAQQPGMFNQATWDAVVGDLPSLPSMSDLTQPFEKLGEVASQIKWGASKMMDNIGDFFSGGSDTPGHMVSNALGSSDALTNMIPQTFKSLTNGNFSSVTENAIKGIGDSLNFDSFKPGFVDKIVGSTDVTSALLSSGIASDAGGPKRQGVELKSIISGDVVYFNVTPTISEERGAMYDDVTPAHHPGSMLKYNHTAARGWSIGSIKLISRNIAEATENQRIINILRSWLMPYYGYGTEAENRNMLGAPPDLLELNAYGSKNIGNISVVLTQLNIDWPNDVDYLHTADGQAFPVIMNVSISLKEAWSPREYSGFSLGAYKKGDMKGAYDGSRATPSAGEASAKPTETPKGIDAAPTPTNSSSVTPTSPAATNASTAKSEATTNSDDPFSQPFVDRMSTDPLGNKRIYQDAITKQVLSESEYNAYGNDQPPITGNPSEIPLRKFYFRDVPIYK